MKQIRFIYAILILSFLCFENVKGQITVTGKITGDIPETVGYSIPIKGIVYGGFKGSVKTDSIGNFQIKLQPEKTSFIIVMIPGRLTSKMIVEPGQQYNISIELNNDNHSFKVLGANAEGQNLYASLPNPSFISIETQKFKNDTSIKSITEKIANLKDNEISKFKALLDNKEISQAFFDLVRSDRDCYYAVLSSAIPLAKFYETNPEKLNEFPSDMKQFWDNVFSDYPISRIDLMGSSFWFEYAKNYVRYKEFTQKDFNVQKLKEYYEKGLIHTHNIQESKKYISDPMLEYYQAAYIYIESLQLKYEKELMSIFAEFKKDWPESEFIEYLEPMINPIMEYHKIAGQPFSKEIKFVENYEKLNSLKECLASFKGKKIYIDVWATWCGPCKKEFEYKTKLTEKLKSNGYEILYISIDDTTRDQQWKEMIKFYSLEGYHIRANDKLSNELHFLYDKNKGIISIPWKLIIDKNGEIQELHAHGPSELNELEKELMEK